MRPIRTLLLLAALAVAAVACGDDGDDPAGSDQQGSTAPGDGAAFTVDELLAAAPEGEVAVDGLVFDDGDGLVLCAVLAESFPPQCPGSRLAIANPVEVETAVELTSASGVRWSDRPVTLRGSLTGDGLDVVSVDVG